MKRAIDIDRRRVLVAGSVATAAAAIGTVSPRSAAQALRESTRSLPGYASWKDEADVIVHSSNTIETRRDAFGTSGVTDEDILFVRNNLAPDPSFGKDPDGWKVQFEGVVRPRSLSVAELKRMGLAMVAMVLQCSGNGRGFFDHKASGTQWRAGAMGNTIWSGIPVKAVVAELGGVLDGLRYMTSTGGEKLPPEIDPKTAIVERSVPLAAFERALLAWELNGQPIPLAHGGPLRIVVPGYYGINNVKYVKRVAFTRDESAANIMRTGYRVRAIGMKGAPTQPSMWEMNLKSVLTHPATETLAAGPMQVHGVAFAGSGAVKAVEVSLDGGRTWQAAQFFGPDLGRYAWRQFVLPVRLARGSYVVASRAIGSDGAVQPEARLENERGYGHNGWRDHAITLTIT